MGGLSGKLHVISAANFNGLWFHSAATGGSSNLSYLTFWNWTADDSVFIAGSAVSDILIGSARSDTISGLDGIDLLRGGRGPIFLPGGDDADRFDFNSVFDSRKGAASTIVIDDFEQDRWHDRIDLKTIDANTHVNGNQKFHFIGDDAFHHREGELRFRNGLVKGDVDGDGRADFEIAVENVIDLVRADFVL